MPVRLSETWASWTAERIGQPRLNGRVFRAIAAHHAGYWNVAAPRQGGLEVSDLHWRNTNRNLIAAAVLVALVVAVTLILGGGSSGGGGCGY